MTEHRPPQRSRVDAVVDIATRRSAVITLLLALAASTGIIALLGGFDEVAETVEIESVAVGEWTDTQPYSLAVLSARRADTVGYSEAGPGTEFLIVDLEVVNTWDRGVARLRDSLLLDLGDGEPLEPDRTLTSADRVDIATVPPRVPTAIRLVWEVPSGAVGPTATLQVIDATLITEGRLITVDYWSLDRVAGVVTVDVVDRPDAHDDGDEDGL